MGCNKVNTFFAVTTLFLITLSFNNNNNNKMTFYNTQEYGQTHHKGAVQCSLLVLWKHSISGV